MKNLPQDIQPDSSQQRVINEQKGFHLVLAPPGCGKTQILTQRIQEAHRRGVAYADMLCLTFTNRAARGMAERIQESIQDADANEVYVGNVHRFCSKFLFENKIIPASASVIDDDDAISILASYVDDDEQRIAHDYRKKKNYSEVIFLSHLITQIAHQHPKDLRLHPECLHNEDITALTKICQLKGIGFTPQALEEIYQKADSYEDWVKDSAVDYATQCLLLATLKKMQLANHYEKYKQTNNLIDFEDLLIMTYDTLTTVPSESTYKHYSWIQVDEVQDLNPMQLAIIDAITAPTDAAVMYLGDEQQAIFSFMGAKLSTLAWLKERCGDNVHHLSTNHRSPKYLLQVFHEYAEKVLKIDAKLLPQAGNDDMGMGDELKIVNSDFLETEYMDVARLAGTLLHHNPKETTAIIVNANHDADDMSTTLLNMGLQHFKVSGQDLFASPTIKLLLAHLNVLANDNNFIAWARLLKGTGVFQSNVAARNFVQTLFRNALRPSDLLSPHSTSYIAQFKTIYDDKEMVVFDTETTGLDVFEDEIVQIAAVKIRQGKIVEGSHLNIFIATNKAVPEYLGDLRNPVFDIIGQQTLLQPQEALNQFMEYVGDSILIGHNALYDYRILDQQLRRHCPQHSLSHLHPFYIDTLQLIRLIHPHLKQYKLASLIETLHLEGKNSHLADEDVHATVGLINYCYQHTEQILQAQQQLMARPRVQECIRLFRHRYMEHYNQAKASLHLVSPDAHPHLLTQEIQHFYSIAKDERWAEDMKGVEYICRYIEAELLEKMPAPSLYEQLNRHILSINTLKEADLCGSSVINERIYLTTIHKAKGLEFDNVIIFDAIDGRIPNFYNNRIERLYNEDARKFYVAMTRAKKRLFVSQCLGRINYRGEVTHNQLTPFMTPLLPFFEVYKKEEEMEAPLKK